MYSSIPGLSQLSSVPCSAINGEILFDGETLKTLDQKPLELQGLQKKMVFVRANELMNQQRQERRRRSRGLG